MRYALRTLRRTPTFTAIVLATLSVSIGLNTTIFSILYDVLLRPLPYRDPGRLVNLVAETPDYKGPAFSYTSYLVLKRASRPFDDAAVLYQHTGISRVTLTGAEPEVAQAGFVSANFFPVVGVSPAMGRVFSSDEEIHQERVAILSHTLWQKRFGGSAEAIGAKLDVNGTPFRVIGVMPREYQLPARDIQFWAPITTNPQWSVAENGPGPLRWNIVARLKPGVSMAAAQSESSAIAQFTVRLEPLRPPVEESVRLALTMLAGAVLFVLLIACANITNLFLARGAAREREFALRAVLGAGRGTLVRQVLMETAILAGTSGLIGIGLAAVGLDTLLRFARLDIPRIEQVSIKWEALTFTAGVCVVAMLVVSIAPVWRILRRDPNEPLAAGARSVTGSRRFGRLRRLLVVGEFAMAMVLLTGAALMVRSFLAVQAVDLGYEPGPALIVRVYPRSMIYVSQVLNRLARTPGIEAAGGIDDLFHFNVPIKLGFRAIEGQRPESRQEWTALTWDAVSGDYFHAMGAKLLKGRFFTDQDGPDSPLVAVIDESLARRYWPNEDPIGKRFKGQDPRGRNDDWLTVIGVVRNMRRQGLERETTPHVYEWYRQSRALTRDIVVRTRDNPASFAAAVRAAVRSVDRSTVITRVTTLDSEIEEQTSERRFQTWLMGLFASVGLGLAAIGIYGLMHYTVAYRTREIAIRMAVGARIEQVVGMTLREGVVLSMIGAGMGVVAAFGTNRLLSGLLFGVRPGDLWTLVSASLLLVAGALLGSALPAFRAAKVDPVTVLRLD